MQSPLSHHNFVIGEPSEYAILDRSKNIVVRWFTKFR